MKPALTAEVMKRLGIHPGAAMKDAELVDSEIVPSSLAVDYELLITECFRLLGLTSDLVRVSVRPVGVNPAGMDIYAAFIKVLRWEPAVIQVLTRMPQVEKKIERCIRQSSMLRYSAFTGLWFRSPPHLEAQAATVH